MQPFYKRTVSCHKRPSPYFNQVDGGKTLQDTFKEITTKGSKEVRVDSEAIENKFRAL